MTDNSDYDEDDTFVTIGAPLEVPDEDEPKKRPVLMKDVQASDTKGRPRFHGAFTGGFSAGYFNSVGSLEGWAPSTFVSSRQKREGTGLQQKPEDFMDEEDVGEFGIAPRKFVTSAQFSSEERKRRRFDEASLATSDSIIPGESAILDLIIPERITVGVKLLRKMGWKEGQGVGPRLNRKQKQKQNAGMKLYGCAMPPNTDSDDDGLDDDLFLSNITYAPGDTHHILLSSKNDTKGLGYRGLDPSLALPSTHISLFGPPVITKSGRKGIRGQAFGVGALESEDADIYAVDHMSNYDMTMGEEGDDTFGWTGSKHTGKVDVPIGYVGKMLDGFTLSSKKLVQKKDFPPPKLPVSFRPVHKFLKKEDDSQSFLIHSNNDGVDYRQFLCVKSETTTAHHPTATVKKYTDASSRSMALDEVAFVGSVFDLIPQKDRAKMEKVRQSESLQTSSHIQEVSGIGATTHSESNIVPHDASTYMHSQNASPLTRAASFQPFSKDPDKQLRYERYLELIKQGHKDPYSEVALAGNMDWDREHEKEEFIKAARLYQPLAGMIAARFTRGGTLEDSSQTETRMEQTIDLTDAQKAAEMKMYGKLTREMLEWHPDNLVCKRFNVPNPYPGSSIVGLGTVKREKYSVFNFLNFANPTSAELQPLTDSPSEKDNGSSKITDEKVVQAGNIVDKELSKGKAMKSIFSHLVNTENATQKATSGLSFSLKPSKSKLNKEYKSIFSHLDDDSAPIIQKPVAIETDKADSVQKAVVMETDKTDAVQSDINKSLLQQATSKSEGKLLAKEDKTDDMDLFRAIFCNTDSEESSSSSEDEIKAGVTSEDVTAEVVATPSQQLVGLQPAMNSKMYSAVDVDTDKLDQDKPAMLPGNGASIETITERLAPSVDTSSTGEMYGPELPQAHCADTSNSQLLTVVAMKPAEYIDLTGKRSIMHKHKHKDKHKHKKEKKDKKEKHKKNKHKKKQKKKERKKSRKDYSSTSSETSYKDTDDDGPSDNDILMRLRSLPAKERSKVKDLL